MALNVEFPPQVKRHCPQEPFIYLHLDNWSRMSSPACCPSFLFCLRGLTFSPILPQLTSTNKNRAKAHDIDRRLCDTVTKQLSWNHFSPKSSGTFPHGFDAGP